MSVVIFHPMVAPHVQHAARAIYESGHLDRFVTSVRDDPASLPQKLMTSAGRLFGLKLAREFSRRTVSELPLDRVESHPWAELLRVATGRLGVDPRVSDYIWDQAEQHFDELVARRLHRGLTGVYGYEYGSLATFSRARNLGLRIGYEMPAPESHFVRNLLDRELVKFPELRTRYFDYTGKREEVRTRRRRSEWEAADVIIAASEFTKHSYARAGRDVSRVRVIPLGAPPAVREDIAATGGSDSDASLRFLWVGTFSIRKGAHYLIDAWQQGGFGRRARLDVFGTNELPDRFLQPSPENVFFHGSIPRAQLGQHYVQSDALIFPTLCDGFGMVVTEAWAHGLPVITTDCAGASDLLKPGENGILIGAGSTAAIIAAIDGCLADRRKLHAMRRAAAATAAAWQWHDYRAALATTLRNAGLFSQ
jgi:glycosyltransferase involved in cell wall biosynthesis